MLEATAESIQLALTKTKRTTDRQQLLKELWKIDHPGTFPAPQVRTERHLVAPTSLEPKRQPV